MLSPATKIFLRTSEAHAAKWIADTIGEVRNRTPAGEPLEWTMGPSPPAELRTGAPGRAVGDGKRDQAPCVAEEGYLKLRDLVVRLHVPFLELPSRSSSSSSKGTSGVTAATMPVHLRGIHRGPAQRLTPAELHTVLAQPTSQAHESLLPIRLRLVLTISKPSAGQARRYHAEEFQNARENYYAEASGSSVSGTGSWPPVGIERRVREDTFSASAGEHPITGEALVRHQTARLNQRAGRNRHDDGTPCGMGRDVLGTEDGVVDALVGDDGRVREAHEASVDVALGELERYVQARLGGNRRAETTGNWVAAKFEHDSARPVNKYAAPQLHTHVVVFNLTHTVEGDVRPLQPRELYKTQQYATAVYRSELATRLAALGYDIERGKSGQPEITGYGHEYVDASSPRRKQIEEHLAKGTSRGAATSQIRGSSDAGSETRRVARRVRSASADGGRW